MDYRTIFLPLMLLALFLMVGCSYNHKNFLVKSSDASYRDDFIIQFDDFGQIWDQTEADAALERIASLATQTNVIVSIFIHGWHHNASPADKNLEDFMSSVEKTRSRLIDSHNPESEPYRSSRRHPLALRI